ncbi:hypothetical protein AURDEDRAFT_177664 [Auricularia subglabra TFB-10046 SS5]|uniref:Uncharacterized protein n=1 Tax=Auricularia subglabra (strain TFB-10046 / SS5) TaxID=717982 RepID=J0WLQ8_AURST|nr:hypothetical protein AURDEDRAFT_177664 [Auricularia subglabra TFB-10046 SS5]
MLLAGYPVISLAIATPGGQNQTHEAGNGTADTEQQTPANPSTASPTPTTEHSGQQEHPEPEEPLEHPETPVPGSPQPPLSPGRHPGPTCDEEPLEHPETPVPRSPQAQFSPDCGEVGIPDDQDPVDESEFFVPETPHAVQADSDAEDADFPSPRLANTRRAGTPFPQRPHHHVPDLDMLADREARHTQSVDLDLHANPPVQFEPPRTPTFQALAFSSAGSCPDSPLTDIDLLSPVSHANPKQATQTRTKTQRKRKATELTSAEPPVAKKAKTPDLQQVEKYHSGDPDVSLP